MINPYGNIEKFQHHYKALEYANFLDLNLTTQTEQLFEHDDKIVTLGSCFAQHVSRYLVNKNFNVLISEPNHSKNFSANYGNIYSAKQALQLLLESTGKRKPVDYIWKDNQENLCDAIRLNAPDTKFTSSQALSDARDSHLSKVKDLFERANVIIFTLGLTETWLSSKDGTAYPVAPGVVAGNFDKEKYEFKNFNVFDVIEDLESFVDTIRITNPMAKIIFTVSPVPLVATYEKRHVVVSSIYSKSVLRSAVEIVVQNNPNCRYFHSYELIVNQLNQSRYFEDDFREVSPEGVNYVMRNFEMAYLSSKKRLEFEKNKSQSSHERITEIVCDEDLLR